MRTLGEILGIVHDGGKPEYDELRYALRAMESLSIFDMLAFARLADRESQNKDITGIHGPESAFERRFERMKGALAMSPKDYLGPNNDPDSAEYQANRGLSKKIYHKSVGQSRV